MKKIVAFLTVAALSVAFCMPVLAASPTTLTVMQKPVTVPKAVAASKGYVLSEEEEKLVSTTPEQAVQHAAGLTAETETKLPEGVLFGSLPADPAMISLAKADLLKHTDLQKKLQKLGVNGIVAGSAQLLFSDGRTGRHTVNITAAGLIPGEKVALLVYTPGNPNPKVVKATWKDGKLRANLTLPCTYTVIK